MAAGGQRVPCDHNQKLGTFIIFRTLNTMVKSISNEIHFLGLETVFWFVGTHQRISGVCCGSTCVWRLDPLALAIIIHHEGLLLVQIRGSRGLIFI